MKKLTAMILACLMLAGMLSGCASTADDEGVEYHWKMALNSTEGDNAYDTGVLFAQKVKELTNGRVRVELYGGAAGNHRRGAGGHVRRRGRCDVRVHRYAGYLYTPGQH